MVLGVAAVTTMLFQLARLPVALGYILAGMVIGPHVPIPIVANPALVSTLSELGVIMLMFTIGLEFSVRTIARVGAPAAMTAVVEVGLMVALGYLVTLYIFGWTPTEALFAGACLGISSTMLVAKAFEELELAGDFTELVFAILVFEDLIAIVLLAILTAVASGSGLGPDELVGTIGELFGFLAAMLIGGLLVVPRLLRLVARFGRPETLLITSLAICFGMATIAEHAGYSIALGAFLAGMLVAESGKAEAVDAMVRPFRDVFAAIFFVSVGMTIDPKLVADNAVPIIVLAVVVFVGKVAGISVGAFLAGNGLRPAVRAGFSLAQIGEFSFIIAALGVDSGATGGFLLPVAVAVSCATALATPWMIRGSDRVASRIAANLPGPVATFVSFYESWLDRWRHTDRPATLWRRLRRPIMILVIDAVLLAAVVIGTVAIRPRVVPFLSETFGVGTTAALVILIGVAVGLGALFAIAVIRRAIRLARLLAAEIIPRVSSATGGELDLGTAPRRSLILVFEIAIALVVGIPLAAVTQPFVPGGAAIVLVVLLGLVLAARRSITNFDGHVRAGSELIVEVLARQGHSPSGTVVDPTGPQPSLAEVESVLPGFGGITTIALVDGAPAVGRSLAELDLRARTGASVLAIDRDGGGHANPSPKEPLRAGDILALTGSDESIAAARTVLIG
jgi:CPA2 family monovalent cation:H+ antiporter-2